MKTRIKEFISETDCEIREYSTKKGEKVFVSFYENNCTLFIRLCSPNSDLKRPTDSEVYCRKKLNLFDKTKLPYLEVESLISFEKRKGYGSLLLQIVIEETKRIGYHKVRGKITNEDYQRQKQFLIEFYEDLSFTFIDRPSGLEKGYFELILNK